MKRLPLALIAALFAILAVFPCAACAPQDEPLDPNAPTIMGKASDLQRPYMQRVFALYKEQGKNINVVSVPDLEFETTVTRKFASGEGPDILMHFHDDDLNRLGIEAHFYFMNDESWASDLTESAAKYCTDAEGNLLGLPFWESSVSGCYYNKKLLAESGYTSTPTGQDQFDVLCRELTREGITPIFWPGKESWMYQFGLDPIFADLPDGPELLAKLNNKEISYADIPAVTDMVTWLSQAEAKGWLGDDFLDKGWDDIGPALASGEAAMTFIWDTWFYTDDFKAGKYKREDFALMPVFMNTVEGGTYEGGNLNMMMANKNSDKLDKALEFISFCAQPENYNAAFDGISTVSCFRGQTTNIQSHMVTDPDTARSIAKKERVSTATTKIAGYSATDMADVFSKLFAHEIDIAQCVALMDQLRLEEMSAT